MQSLWTRIRDMILNDPVVRHLTVFALLIFVGGTFWIRKVSYQYPGPAIAVLMLALAVLSVGLAINKLRADYEQASRQVRYLQNEKQRLTQEADALRANQLESTSDGRPHWPAIDGLDLLINRWHRAGVGSALIYGQFRSLLSLLVRLNVQKMTLIKAFVGVKPQGGVFLVELDDRVLRVLKFDRVTNIEKEKDNFTRYVRNVTNFTAGEQFDSWLPEADYRSGEQQGVVLYKYAQLESDNPQTLAEYYQATVQNREGRADQLENVLAKILTVMDRWWRPIHTPFDEKALYGEYDRLGRYLTRMRQGIEDKHTAEAFEKYMPQAMTHQASFQLAGISDRTFLNPLGWVGEVFVNESHFIRWLTDMSKKRPRHPTEHISVVHGDFHAGNILIEGQAGNQRIWLIDFPHTHIGPTLQDIARLEADIKFGLLAGEQLSGAQGISTILAFETDILGNGRRSSLDLTEKTRHPLGAISVSAVAELDTVWRSLAILRRPVRTHYLLTDDARPYYLALLHATLPMLYYRDRSPWQKLYAFISAALLCEHLNSQPEDHFRPFSS